MSKEQFKEWRVAMGWTQEEAGENLDIHPKTVSNYERGTQPVPVVVEYATEHLKTKRAA
tara:strand:- start:83 stop:259 length:177 start_codon:yes stop_codon:yes gene_type:complete